MQIQVKSKSSEGAPSETFMIEMQGDLESRNKEHLEGKFIGDLHYTKDLAQYLQSDNWLIFTEWDL